MNLATRWNHLFWECATLCVNSGSTDNEFGDDDDDEISDEEDDSKKSITINYPKIARALSGLQQRGVRIELPDVNTSVMDFTPDLANNAINYSLSAIININQEIASAIINNRPYNSLEDFMQKVSLTTVQMISLIKSGAFDKLYPNKTRQQIMVHYLHLICPLKNRSKISLTTELVNKLYRNHALNEEQEFNARVFLFQKWIDKEEYNAATKSYILKSEDSRKFFINYLSDFFVGKYKDDATSLANGIEIKKTTLNKSCDRFIATLKGFVNSPEGITACDKIDQTEAVKELYDKYCQGSVSTWEMSSLSYYYHDHELKNVLVYGNTPENFDNLPFDLVPTGTRETKSGEKVNTYDIKLITGTVIGCNKGKHMVYLLTEHGVVDVKFYAGAFINYDKQIKVPNDKGGLKVAEPSWFLRGTKLAIFGVRKEDTFVPKTPTAFFSIKTSVGKIIDITNGEAQIVWNRSNNNKKRG